jgi:hypothetical protein
MQSSRRQIASLAGFGCPAFSSRKKLVSATPSSERPTPWEFSPVEVARNAPSRVFRHLVSYCRLPPGVLDLWVGSSGQRRNRSPAIVGLCHRQH